MGTSAATHTGNRDAIPEGVHGMVRDAVRRYELWCEIKRSDRCEIMKLVDDSSSFIESEANRAASRRARAPGSLWDHG